MAIRGVRWRAQRERTEGELRTSSSSTASGAPASLTAAATAPHDHIPSNTHTYISIEGAHLFLLFLTLLLALTVCGVERPTSCLAQTVLLPFAHGSAYDRSRNEERRWLAINRRLRRASQPSQACRCRRNHATGAASHSSSVFEAGREPFTGQIGEIADTVIPSPHHLGPHCRSTWHSHSRTPFFFPSRLVGSLSSLFGALLSNCLDLDLDLAPRCRRRTEPLVVAVIACG